MSFEHASVTKGIIIVSALTSILAGLFDVKHYFHLQLVPHISRHHQYWRLLTHNLAFLNSSDLLLGILIFYNVGIQIERQFGSVKYASFAVVTLLVGTLSEFIALLLFHRIGLNYIALGPSLLIFSILYQYSRIVPSVYTFRIFGLPLNNKSINYFLGLQIAISRLPGSAVAAAIGVLTGQIYRSDLTGLKSWRISPTIVSFSKSVLAPLLGSLRAPRRTNRALGEDARSSMRGPTSTAGADTRADANRGDTESDSDYENDEVITTARSAPTSGLTPRTSGPSNEDRANAPSASVMREWVNELTGRAERANAGVRAPSDAEISQLTSMFPDLDREVIVGTLQRSANIEAAVDTLLLSQQT